MQTLRYGWGMVGQPRFISGFGLALVALAKDPATSHRARRTAERWFSLDRAVEAYDELYAAMPRYHNRPALTGDRSWP